MTAYRKGQNNFTAGVIGERAYGRTDVAKYQNGLRDMDGFVPLEQGGVRTLQGTTLLDSGGKFGTGIIKAFGFRDSYLYWTTQSGSTVLIDAETDEEVIQYTTGAAYLDRVNHLVEPVDVSVDCHIVQSGDVMFIAFKDGKRPVHVVAYDSVAERVRIAPWGLIDQLGEDLTGLNIPNKIACTPYADSTTNGNVFTLDSSGNLTCTEPFFTGTDENYNGRHIKVNTPTHTHVLIINNRVSDTEVNGAFLTSGAASVTSDDVQIALWGGDIAPATVTLHGGRSAWGGQKEGIPNMSLSRDSNLFFMMHSRLKQAVDETTDELSLKFYGDPLAEDPITMRISSNEYETIETCISHTSLFFGTTKGLYEIRGGEVGITATEIYSEKISNLRCSNVQPLGLESSVVLSDINGRIYAIKYVESGGGFLPYDISLMYQPIEGLYSMSYDYINSMIFFKTSDKPADYDYLTQTLHYCTYKESAGIIAFGSTTVGGTVYAGGGYREYGITDIFRYGDTVCMTVLRHNDEGSFTYVSKFEENNVRLYGMLTFLEGTSIQYVPAYGGSTLKVISNTNGVYTQEADIVVPANGGITLTVPAGSIYLVGECESASLTTVPPVVATESGSGLDALGRIDRVTARFRQTTGGSIGTRENYMSDIFALADEMPYSGLKQISLDCGQSLETTVTITQDDPFPMEVTSLVFRGQIFE